MSMVSQSTYCAFHDASMTHATSKRRGRGEDSIYWDATKSCYVGAVSLGYRPSGTRVRKRVMARTKTEVREKLKALHQQAENGVRPRRHYTVNDALDDWLSTGLDGLAPATMTVYRGTIAKALREELGTVKLNSLTAGAVQKALANLAAGGRRGRCRCCTTCWCGRSGTPSGTTLWGATSRRWSSRRTRLLPAPAVLLARK
jgi:hypothetical protein